MKRIVRPLKGVASLTASLAVGALSAYSRSRVSVVVGLLAVFGVGAASGAAVSFANIPVRTEILPISDGCADFHQAGRDYYDADKALERAEKKRAAVGAAYDDRISGGTAEDIEKALKAIDEAQRVLAGAQTTKIAAGNALLDADNRCITELEEVRG